MDDNRDQDQDQNPEQEQQEREQPQQEQQQPAQRQSSLRDNIRRQAREKVKEQVKQQVVNMAKKRAAQMAATAAASSIGPYVIGVVAIIVIIILLLLFIFFIWYALFGGDQEAFDPSAEAKQVKLQKSAPAAVQNGETITYTITATYPQSANQIEVTDAIPANAEFIEATGNYRIEKDSGGIPTSVIWTLTGSGSVAPEDSGASSGASLSNLNAEKFASYGFPEADPLAVTIDGNTLQKWKTEMLPHARKAALVTSVDVGILGMWPVYEGTNYDAYYDNCDDPKVRKNAHADSDPNTPCPVTNWQVGYGVRPVETIEYLEEALDAMYGDHTEETIQKIGQTVIDNSKIEDTTHTITYPSQTFPALSVNELVIGTKKNDLAVKTYAGVLMKDKALGTYLLAKVFKGIAGPNMAEKMSRWGSYYDPQKIINTIAAVYEGGIEASGVGMQTQSMTLTLRPKENDTYVINQAGVNVQGSLATDINLQTSTAPTQDNCGGKYDLTTNPTGLNFGDPSCDYSNDKLFEQLYSLDSKYAEEWYYKIIPCESGYNPNIHASQAAIGTPDAAGAWGLFQMGRGKNGAYDHGDVPWGTQIFNAITYNNKLIEQNIGFKYWECAIKNNITQR